MNILNMHHKLADKIERSISNPKEYTTLANVCIKTGINIKDAEKGILVLINFIVLIAFIIKEFKQNI